MRLDKLKWPWLEISVVKSIVKSFWTTDQSYLGIESNYNE
jgi:hypothetical protein